MPKQKLSAKDIQAAEAAEDLARMRELGRQLGRCLSLTIMAATAGSSVEDYAIASMDRAWEKLADLIVDFAEREDHAQGL